MATSMQTVVNQTQPDCVQNANLNNTQAMVELPEVAPSVASKRREAARRQLTSSMQDRRLPAALRWNRSLTEINIHGYKERCRQIGRTCYGGTQHSRLDETDTSDSRRNMSRDTDVHTDNHTLALPTIPSTSSAAVTSESKPRISSRKKKKGIKISRLYDVLHGDKSALSNNKPNSNIRISIDSVPGASYPHVQLVIKACQLELENRYNVQTNVKTKTTAPPSTGAVPKLEHNTSSSRGRVNFDGVEIPAVLRKLNKSQQNSQEKTRRWLQQNPVGLPHITQDGAPEWDTNSYAMKFKQVRFQSEN